MKPGQYLKKRRHMAGYSLSCLARDIIVLDGFGSCVDLSTFRRLELRLISAEDGVLPLGDRLIDLVRNFVPLDRDLYRQLVALDRRGASGPVSDICRTCGCSFHDPCVNPPRGSAAPLGRSVCRLVEPDLCSGCAELELASLTPQPTGERDIIRLVPNEGIF